MIPPPPHPPPPHPPPPPALKADLVVTLKSPDLPPIVRVALVVAEFVVAEITCTVILSPGWIVPESGVKIPPLTL